MTTKYRLAPMKFDTLKWSKTIAAIPVRDRDDFGYAIGVAGGTLKTWANLKQIAQFPFPSMNAFINACNMLDLDPRDFFILEDS